MRCRNLSRNALLSYSATRGEEQLETVRACGGWGSSLEKRCVGMSSVTLVTEEVVHLLGSVRAWGGRALSCAAAAPAEAFTLLMIILRSILKPTLVSL